MAQWLGVCFLCRPPINVAQGLIPGLSVKCGLSFLLVLVRFFSGTLVFPFLRANLHGTTTTSLGKVRF